MTSSRSVRVHVLHVDEAAPIDSKHVKKHLEEHRERVRKAKEAAEGVQQLPMGDEDGDLPVGEQDE